MRSREASTGIANLPQTTAVICDGGRFVLKPFQRLEEGSHPAWDIGLLLSEKRGFPAVAPLAGAIEYRRRAAEPATIAVLHGFVQNEGNAWNLALDTLSDYLERVAAFGETAPLPPADAWPTESPSPEPSDLVKDLLGELLDHMRLLGQRTAEMHLAMEGAKDQLDFVPEGFSARYQRSIYQSMRTLKIEVFDSLRRQLPKLPEDAQQQAQEVLRHDTEIIRRFRLLVDQRFASARIRCHGDLHLAQVLFTGKDFVFLDFEGPSPSSLSERRTKRSPLRDVATMLRSFHYVAQTALFGQGAATPQAVVRPEDLGRLQPWSRFWCAWVGAEYLKSYFATAGQASFIPPNAQEMKTLFDAFVLERALIELAYELRHRPAWTRVPLTGILDILNVSLPEPVTQSSPITPSGVVQSPTAAAT